jgi:hypothetical protein
VPEKDGQSIGNRPSILQSSKMKVAPTILLLTAASQLAEGQQAPRRWRKNRVQAAREDATILLFPIAVQASEQSERTKTASGSRLYSTIKLLNSRPRGSIAGARSRGSFRRAAVVDSRSRGSKGKGKDGHDEYNYAFGKGKSKGKGKSQGKSQGRSSRDAKAKGE